MLHLHPASLLSSEPATAVGLEVDHGVVGALLNLPIHVAQRACSEEHLKGREEEERFSVMSLLFKEW